MRISVTRSGGFAGITRRAEVNTSALPDPDGWQALVSRVDLAEYRDEPTRQPDRFVYTVDIDGTSAHFGETDLTDALRELIDRVFATAG